MIIPKIFIKLLFQIAQYVFYINKIDKKINIKKMHKKDFFKENLL